jgi:hypothetical protein
MPHYGAIASEKYHSFTIHFKTIFFEISRDIRGGVFVIIEEKAVW